MLTCPCRSWKRACHSPELSKKTPVNLDFSASAAAFSRIAGWQAIKKDKNVVSQMSKAESEVLESVNRTVDDSCQSCGHVAYRNTATFGVSKLARI
jgi:hypothetical protein